MTTGDVVYSLRFFTHQSAEPGSTAGESRMLTARLHMLYVVISDLHWILVASPGSIARGSRNFFIFSNRWTYAFYTRHEIFPEISLPQRPFVWKSQIQFHQQFAIRLCVDLLFVLCFMASWTCEVMRVMVFAFNLLAALSMSLLVMCVVFHGVYELFVESVCYVYWCCVCFLLNVIVMFFVGAGCLFESPCSVFHHMSVLCLWWLDLLRSQVDWFN